ncbi:2-C-methyl-D-erythritol 2,4-cyclodiphosphate synthase [Brevinematales bacterium NS]|nr:2-C-methyl-D-erythritol 2,4-cyclodiphosphate synthase [Brevinematales bacterium NS]
MLRVGLGYDLHRLARGLPLWIGGVRIESPMGCVAHSDGDVLVHALIDALVGPFAHTDVGTLFPDTDERYRGIRSLDLLREVKERILEGVKIHNIDMVIILDSPKLSPYRESIRQNIAQVLDIPVDAVSLKAKTSEHTALDRIVCHVVVLLEKEERQKE